LNINTMKKRKKLIIYQVKKGAQKAAHGASAGLMIFLALIILSISFLLFQLKEIQINKDIKEIRELRNEIEELESLNHHLRSNELNLEITLDQPKILTVKRDKLKRYVKKDKEISQ
jgi:hypothetical protein